MVKTLSTNTSLDYFKNHAKKASNAEKKSVIIMDEVDGMSGSDRGGVAAII